MKTRILLTLFLFTVSFAGAQDNPIHGTKADLENKNSFSMIIYPDPQGYMKYIENQPIFELMTQWTASNIDRLNIKTVLCTGDLVDFQGMLVPNAGKSNQNSIQQWESSSKAFSRLDGKIPYINCLGNHDYGYKAAENRHTYFNTYFPVTRNSKWEECLIETAHNAEGLNTLENAAYEFSDENWGKILVIALEFTPRTEILEWAKKLCDNQKYSGHKVIILTHSYMSTAAKVYDTDNYLVSPANYGKDIWEKLLYPCTNIDMLICGHAATIGDYQKNVSFRTDKNAAGKNVYQMMFNAQTIGGGWEGNGGDGWLRILEFMPDGKTIKVRTFSPLLAISALSAEHAWRTEPYDQFDIVVE